MRAYVRGKYMKKLKTIIQRKKWNMILGISDIIMMIIASYLALLTRFEFYPSQIAPIFLKNAAKYMLAPGDKILLLVEMHKKMKKLAARAFCV